MKVVIEIDTECFDECHQAPKAAAAQVAIILDRLIHGRAGETPNAFLTRGVVGGDLIALLDTGGRHVGAYHVASEG
jgi:hypothetical protein